MAERGGRRLIGLAAVAGAGLALSGCLGGPTYGTGVSANKQLVNDLSSMMSLAPKERQKIDYKPRPELVKPGQAELAENALPAPQQAVASADNPQWPESPEERRARIRATATDNQDNPFYEPEVASERSASAVQNTGPRRSARADEYGVVSVSELSKGREGFNKRLAENTQGSPTSRRYLSEPPLDYRKPSDAAPQNDIGEDEWKKEKRLKAEARKKAGKSGWFDWLPGT